MIVYRLMEDLIVPWGRFDKNDIISQQTLDLIMTEYYEVKVVVIQVQ